MLPLYLSIEGLYSYQEKQEIDFTQLTESGLFGIFGTVGSGKSSILEAISFALFGDTERLNKTDKRAYNMMNLKSNQTLIVFEFLNFENKKYRFVAQWKRRKNFEDTTTIERTAYEWKDENWIPMDSADGAKVTNLSYSNFRRTIIIPQGQFKEFLELKGKDRSEMMKEIFNLNKFDLGPKVGMLQAQNNRKLENMRGALSGFESISAEALSLKKKEVEEAKESLEITKQGYQELLQKVQSLQEYKDKQNELQSKSSQYQELSSKKEKVKQQEEELNRYEKTSNAFREPLNQIQSLNIDRESLIHKIENFQASKERQSQEIDVLEKEIQDIQKDYLGINTLRAKAEDYKHLLQIKENDKKEIELQHRLTKGDPIVIKAKATEDIVTNKLAELEKQLEILKAEKIDTTQLIDMEKWYQRKESIQQQEKQLQDQLQAAQAQIAEELSIITSAGYLESNWEQMLSNELNLIEQQMLKQRDQETHLKVQARLAGFANDLQNGLPCPLCGALDHPQPMQSAYVNEELDSNERLKNELEQSKRDFLQVRDKLTKCNVALIGKRNSESQLLKTLEQLQDSLAAHIATFEWTGYSTEDSSAFEAQKQKLKLNEEQSSNLELQIKQQREELQRTQASISRFEKELDSIRNEMAVVQGLSIHNKGLLQQIQWEEFKDIAIDEIRHDKLNLDNRIIYIESTYLQLTQKINTFKTKLAEIVGQYNTSKEQLSIYNQQIKARQEQLAKLLKEFQFNDITEVQQIIRRSIPVEQYRQEIQQFYIRLEVLESQIASLNEYLSSKAFTEEELETTADLFALKKEELELQLALTGALEKELSFITVEFGKKEKLLEEFEKLSNRGSNLKTLENLFKGNGFVNYISSIHLRQMCEMANHRFHRLTRNQLSLTVNENNEFEVIDYLNDGHRRSVKTLSGGQSFQASLCLALALAENIQSLNKADRNFFFIDEGFGTQDADSINTVFDTLQYLHQENRVVGIISHVEELKERIPSSITIVKDHEKGSRVSHSIN
ncbi:SbcC/MukB-like Walker B domain-containing protein [Sphingobacterium hotanense]|uniref:SbcC/MukB-like Walker B domain-containing protein n=1 Tax=Sphingobacterium hotanense TaxID=649196 RepID=UPI0011F3BAB3|nr:SMC family ATPase [Sphingobacterium hotanense]